MTAFSISEILKEARRRRVFRVAALYVVGAWIFIQAADLAFPAFGIPESAIRYIWLSALLGFPVAIVFGWRYDISGGRIVRTLKVGEQVDLSLQRSDYIILASLAIVVTVIAIRLGGEISDQQSPVVDSDWAQNVDTASIAVLPFVNMSSDPDNSYFADGISEELLNGLAKVGGLRVLARTSSEAYAYYLRARALVRNLAKDDGQEIKLQEAIGYLEAAVELDPLFSDGFVALASAYFDLAGFHHHWYQPAEAEMAATSAEQAARTALELAPRSSEALRAWGMISDDPDQGAKAIRDAIEANPNNVAAYRDLLMLVIEEGSLEESLDLARKFHLLDPLNAESSKYMAMTLVMDRSLKEASTYFRIAAQLRAETAGENAQRCIHG